ncbi:MAG TPA: AfsR/SARP family transcriptional regulator [Gaiellaceae bacterium]|nr:AfsR/SARP family transcriptional regulator [Gaiellaceae bacterium]
MIDYLLLGPLEARIDGVAVVLPGGRPRAVLARLLLEEGRVVAVESLIDALWGHRPPPSAPKVLQAHVSQLRKVLGAEAIETQAPGYRVTGAAGDLLGFEELTESARSEPSPAKAARLYGEALELWRGRALAEFRREPFALAARRLEELRLDALGARIEAELSLGEHKRLVGELVALVAQEPLREQPRRQLMLALYRSGRQAEALACYRDGRRLLVEELGIEPSPSLQELERAILRHDVVPEPERSVRGPVVCFGTGPVELVAPLAAGGRELLLVELVASAQELPAATARLAEARSAVEGRVRTACFTSTERGADLARLAAEQEAELVIARGIPEGFLEAAPCDVAVLVGTGSFEPGDPVLVPFGGGREEWAALELGAWLSRAHGLPLRLLGAEAGEGRRDASRMLASASLVLQRFAGIEAETAIVAPGAAGILAERGSAIVASLPPGELDATRRSLAERSEAPLLLVRAGLRPGGLAPDRTLTRFSWSLADG